MWGKIHKICGGDEKVKKEKLQSHRGQFEILMMKGREYCRLLSPSR